MDDIIVYGCGQIMELVIQDYDCKLIVVLQRVCEVGLKLNKDKFKFCQIEVKYMGNIFIVDGICFDLDKVIVIIDMRRFENVKVVQRFIGLVIYLFRFMFYLLEICEFL